MGPIWGRQDPGGPHVGPMNLATRAVLVSGTWRVVFFPQLYIACDVTWYGPSYIPWGVSGQFTGSPRYVWWNVLRINTVLFPSNDVKNTEFSQYLPMILASLNVCNPRFRKLIMLWMVMALWRHGGGAWRNALFLTTAILLATSAQVLSKEASLCQARDTKNNITGQLCTPDRDMGRIVVG